MERPGVPGIFVVQLVFLYRYISLLTAERGHRMEVPGRAAS
jgi:hypothetical protein